MKQLIILLMALVALCGALGEVGAKNVKVQEGTTPDKPSTALDRLVALKKVLKFVIVSFLVFLIDKIYSMILF